MSTQETEKREAQRRPAYYLDEFLEVYPCTRSQAYIDIDAGRLQARKSGRRIIITDEDAQAWLRSLPVRRPRALQQSA